MKCCSLIFKLYLTQSVNHALKNHATHTTSPTMLKPVVKQLIISVDLMEVKVSCTQENHWLTACDRPGSLCVVTVCTSLKSYFPAHHHGSLDRQSIKKQNHGPMQKVTIEMQLRPLWPRQDWHNSAYSASTQNKPAQQWSQETCRSMNVNMRNTGWVK